MRVVKPKTGENRYRTSQEALDVVRQMAGRFSDEAIASTLNRLGLKTGAGNTWRKNRVGSVRIQRGLPAFDRERAEASGLMSASQASAKLGVDIRTIRALIVEGVIPAEQVIKFAPWQIRTEVLEMPTVVDRIRRIKTREAMRRGNRANRDTRTLSLPGLDMHVE
jgi:hypothetical protein